MAEDKPREIKITIPLPDELLSLVLPAAAFEHLLQAKKETLLALRSLIDSRIEALEKKKTKKPETKKKIKIE
ncbi:MAG: hypothetical protein NTV82_15195 [Candidatus Aminicenantes bacterium]|jgi:hypothetical protein|nr:hypothetical protein [Candidatus Aminicenantes bacterium]